jgi:hypothetical protein
VQSLLFLSGCGSAGFADAADHFGGVVAGRLREETRAMLDTAPFRIGRAERPLLAQNGGIEPINQVALVAFATNLRGVFPRGNDIVRNLSNRVAAIVARAATNS